MKDTEYEKHISDLQREIRILLQKLKRSEINRQILEEALDTHSRALKARNTELEDSRESLRLSEAKYKDMAHHDNLTKLPNRAFFEECLSNMIEHTKRSDTCFALFFIDIDKFKKINDNFGHPVGDDVLTQTAERIVSCINYNDMVARIGGDEFAVLLSNLHDYQTVENVAKEILKAMTKPFILGKTSYHLGISIGISLYPYDDTDSGKLLEKADIAMYNAKHNGRNSYQLFRNIPLIADNTPAFPKDIY